MSEEVKIEKMSSRARMSLIGSLITCMCQQGTYAAIPVLLVPLSIAFNVTIGEITLLFTFAAAGSFVAALFLGTLLKKLSVKIIGTISGVCLAVFFLLIAFADSIVMLYAGAVVYGIGTVIGGLGLGQTSITWWFVKNRATFVSFLNVAIAIVGLILAPAIAAALESFDVRQVSMIVGVAFGALVIVNALVLMSDHPSKYGLKPYGWELEGQTASPSEDSGEPVGLSVGQMLKTLPFWLIMIGVCLGTGALTGFTNNASAFYQSIGLDAVTAAMGISIYSVVKLAWNPLFGICVDKKGAAFAVTIFGAVGIVTFLLAGVVLSGMSGMVIMAVLVGSISWVGILAPVSLPSIFGAKEAGSVVGFGQAAGSVGAMLGAPIAGFIYTGFGSYQMFMFVAAAFVAVVILATKVAMSKKSVEKIKALGAK